MNTTAGVVSACAATIGALVALGTLIRSMHEYVLQGRQKRSEAFFALRARLKGDARMVEILRLIQDDDPKLADQEEVSYTEKYEVLGYFEEVALMLNSGVVRPAVAWYMFGYYALRLSDSGNFWSNIERADPYWALFNTFAEKMNQLEVEMCRRHDSHGSSAVAQSKTLRF
ncbi:hypothetical protein [Paractinoplanes rishiriensis]|uniref:Uncharacterized protein n=1 Tax=Paractinoplanes rishiriensis TaxID=1050105 RepID=A0A919KBK0_9ACTN|nr:hypothetical protein [Actinoplanes rishiriensis]GIF02388.1 hypothetical protein Ari01nite_98520 [Actinoplanes rishiriensis]